MRRPHLHRGEGTGGSCGATCNVGNAPGYLHHGPPIKDHRATILCDRQHRWLFHLSLRSGEGANEDTGRADADDATGE
jgi:hypothetical protein